MAMNLESFFDLNKVEFSVEELELPYEDFNFATFEKRAYSYTSSQPQVYLNDFNFDKVTVGEIKTYTGVAA